MKVQYQEQTLHFDQKPSSYSELCKGIQEKFIIKMENFVVRQEAGSIISNGEKYQELLEANPRDEVKLKIYENKALMNPIQSNSSFGSEQKRQQFSYTDEPALRNEPERQNSNASQSYSQNRHQIEGRQGEEDPLQQGRESLEGGENKSLPRDDIPHPSEAEIWEIQESGNEDSPGERASQDEDQQQVEQSDARNLEILRKMKDFNGNLSEYFQSGPDHEKLGEILLEASKLCSLLKEPLNISQRERSEQMEELVKEIHKIESKNLKKFKDHVAGDFKLQSIERIIANLKFAEALRKLKYRMILQISSEETRLQYSEFQFYAGWKKKLTLAVQELLKSLALYTENLWSADLLETQAQKIENEVGYLADLKNCLNLSEDSREHISESIQESQKYCQNVIEEKLKRVFFKLFSFNKELIIPDHKELVDLYKKIDKLNKLIRFYEKFMDPGIVLEGLLTELQKTIERRGQIIGSELAIIYLLEKKLPEHRATLEKILNLLEILAEKTDIKTVQAI